MRFQRLISRKLIRYDFKAKIAILSLFSIFTLIFPQYSIAYQLDCNSSYCDQLEICRAIPLSQPRVLPSITNKQYEVKNSFMSTITAYSSSPDETFGDPFTMASGDRVFDGALAHQYLPFGTKVRFPEQFGDKIFVVKDRLHPRHTSQYHFDMWVHSKVEAKTWGARQIKVEILN